MKTLLLLRHAKSDWSQEGQPDWERPLNRRGRRDAPRMGQLLFAEQLIPDLILSSTAQRARETAHKVVAGGELDVHIQEVADFYLAPPATYIEVLQQQNRAVACILVIGHNPGIESLSRRLTRQPLSFPTATLAQIEFDIDDWDDLSLNSQGALRNIWHPRELRA